MLLAAVRSLPRRSPAPVGLLVRGLSDVKPPLPPGKDAPTGAGLAKEGGSAAAADMFSASAFGFNLARKAPVPPPSAPGVGPGVIVSQQSGVKLHQQGQAQHLAQALTGAPGAVKAGMPPPPGSPLALQQQQQQQQQQSRAHLGLRTSMPPPAFPAKAGAPPGMMPPGLGSFGRGAPMPGMPPGLPPGMPPGMPGMGTGRGISPFPGGNPFMTPGVHGQGGLGRGLPPGGPFSMQMPGAAAAAGRGLPGVGGVAPPPGLGGMGVGMGVGMAGIGLGMGAAAGAAAGGAAGSTGSLSLDAMLAKLAEARKKTTAMQKQQQQQQQVQQQQSTLLQSLMNRAAGAASSGPASGPAAAAAAAPAAGSAGASGPTVRAANQFLSGHLNRASTSAGAGGGASATSSSALASAMAAGSGAGAAAAAAGMENALLGGMFESGAAGVAAAVASGIAAPGQFTSEVPAVRFGDIFMRIAKKAQEAKASVRVRTPTAASSSLASLTVKQGTTAEDAAKIKAASKTMFEQLIKALDPMAYRRKQEDRLLLAAVSASKSAAEKAEKQEAASKFLAGLVKSGARKVPVGPVQSVAQFLARSGMPKRLVLDMLKTIDGVERNVYSMLSAQHCELLLSEVGLEADLADVNAGEQALQLVAAAQEDDGSAPRAPVVCILGHVDHGKTTLLDALRKTNRVDGEAGRITQNIGAFTVPVGEDLRSVVPSFTFLDTPGHAIFRNMRTRGSSSAVSDICILVVSAADGVQRQTREAYDLIKQSDRPLLVVITKCDVVGADPAKIRRELVTELALRTEQEGGTIPCVEVSAVKGEGLGDMLEALAVIAQILNLKYIPRPSFTKLELGELKRKLKGRIDGAVPFEAKDVTMAFACVVESHVDKAQGSLLNVIIRQGDVQVGDRFVCGGEVGTIKSLINDKGERVKSASASHSEPVQIMGVEGYEDLDYEIVVVPNDEVAQVVVDLNIARRDLEDMQAEHAAADAAERERIAQQRIHRRKRRGLPIPPALAAAAGRPVRQEKDADDDGMPLAPAGGDSMTPRVQKMRSGLKSLASRERFNKGEKTANQLALEREQAVKEDAELYKQEELRSVRFVVRADVKGALEVIEHYFETLAFSQHAQYVKVTLVRAQLGEFTEADVRAAEEQGYHCIGFNINVSSKLQQLAREKKVQIHSSNVVFTLFDRIQELITAVMPHYSVFHIFGVATVEKLIPIEMTRVALRRLISTNCDPEDADAIDHAGNTVICGSKVTQGELQSRCKWRVRRDGEYLQDGMDTISLRRFKDEVPSVIKGLECGIFISDTSNVREGDHLESYEVRWVPVPFDDSMARGYEYSSWAEPPHFAGARTKYLHELTPYESKRIMSFRDFVNKERK